MKKMTKEEIAKELLDPYFINPDLCSFDGADCLYDGPGGKKCAFAAACVDSVDLREGEDARYQLSSYGQAILKEQYRHIVDVLFWVKVQSVHDTLASGDVCAAIRRYEDLTGQAPPGDAQ